MESFLALERGEHWLNRMAGSLRHCKVGGSVLIHI